MGALGRIEVQHPREPVDDARRGSDVVPLLEPRVPREPDPGQLRDLLAAQARRTTPAARRQADALRARPLPLLAQVLREVVAVIDHPELGRLAVRHLQSIPTSHPDLRLTRFVPADAATRAALG